MPWHHQGPLAGCRCARFRNIRLRKPRHRYVLALDAQPRSFFGNISFFCCQEKRFARPFDYQHPASRLM